MLLEAPAAACPSTLKGACLPGPTSEVEMARGSDKQRRYFVFGTGPNLPVLVHNSLLFLLDLHNEGDRWRRQQARERAGDVR